MRRFLYIFIAVILLSGLSTVAVNYDNNYVYAEETTSSLMFEGKYLVDATSIDADYSRLFVAENYVAFGSVIKSRISVFSGTEGGELVDTGSAIDFAGRIKRVRYAYNRLFVHIEDTLYMVDLMGNNEDSRRIILIDSNFVAFDVSEVNVYCIFDSVYGDHSMVNITPLDKLISEEAMINPQESSYIQLLNGVDIHQSGGYLYIFGDGDKLVRRNISAHTDHFYNKITLPEGCTPERVLSFGNEVAVCGGNSLSFLNVNNEEQKMVTLEGDRDYPIHIADVARIGENIFVLDTNDDDGFIDIKRYSSANGAITYHGSVLGNNTVSGELPDFHKSTFENQVLSGRYELAYATAYPSNVIYAVEGADSECYLKGGILQPHDMIFILNYDTATDFYLIMFDGKLGYIQKHDETLSVAHAGFRSVPDKSRRAMNQSLTVFSLPTSVNRNAFAIEQYDIEIGQEFRVNVHYEIRGFDSDNVKWVYASYTNGDGDLRFGFMYKGDLTRVADSGNIYEPMKANPAMGTKLNIYKEASVESEVILSVDSGERIRVYDKVNGMYLVGVTVNGVVYTGYVADGLLVATTALTNNDIVGIIAIVSVILLIAAAITFGVYFIRKKAHTVKLDPEESFSAKNRKPSSRKRGYGDYDGQY